MQPKSILTCRYKYLKAPQTPHFKRVIAASPGADPGFFEKEGGLRIFIMITKYPENSFLQR
jgi:hypothetical protein